MKAPSKAQPVASPGQPGQAVTSATLTIQGAKQAVTLCQCSRCGHLWKPRRPDPAPSKCPACFSPLWNKARAYRIEGAEAPTRAARPRGKPFEKGFDARRIDHAEGGAAEGEQGGAEPQATEPGPRAKRQTSKSRAPHEGAAHSTADKN